MESIYGLVTKSQVTKGVNKILGVVISEEEYNEYLQLKQKNIPMKKTHYAWNKHCPACGYVVDSNVPKQNYCDRCGQKLKK